MDLVPIWHSPAQVEKETGLRLDAAESIRKGVLAFAGKRTLENTLVPYNDMLIELDRVHGLSELIANVHPDKAVREAAENCQQRVSNYLNSLRLDRDLYQAVHSVDVVELDSQARRLQSHLRRDYHRAGVDRDDPTRQELTALYEKMVDVGQAFDRNIREDRRSIKVSGEHLDGLPEDYLAAHPPGPDGKVTITTDYADFNPFQSYARHEDLRRELYIQFQRRGYPANDKVLKELLERRHRYATLLGYPNWAAYNAEDKMVKTESTIADFIGRVSAMARPRAKNDLEMLLTRKKLDSPQAEAIHEWDSAYYLQKVRAEQFGVNAQVVRTYLEFSRVKEGILNLAQDLFAVTFEKATNADVWHESVEAYDVFDGKQFIGRFFLDLHPRENKYTHAAVFQMLTGVSARQPAEVALVANFPGPGTTERPALMERQDVITFLHEFGHLMHHLLSRNSRWVMFDGLSTEWDFVETPSQLLEEWGRDAGILGRFARHYQSGEPIPPELVARIRQADELGKGIFATRQMTYAQLSLTYHDRDPSNIDLLNTMQQVVRDCSPYPYEPDTYLYASFGHLHGYSSAYYTYMWSLSLAKDVFTEFQRNGLMDKATARRYRETIIEAGGSADAADLVRSFLGRDHSFEAFRKWLEEQ